MRNGEQFNASLQDLTGKPLIAVFTNGRRANLGDVARIYTGLGEQRSGFPTQPAAVAPAGDAGSTGWPEGEAAARS